MLAPGQIVEVVPEPIAGVVRKGTEGILVRKESKPTSQWLAAQQDPRSREHAHEQWWAVMPLGGGLLLVPEPVLRSLRVATRGDVLKAADHGNDDARRMIAGLFPGITADIIRDRNGK